MDRCPPQTYILQGYGAIQPQWVRHCLQLFRQEQVNLRKVVLLKNNAPDCFSMLELHFLLPQTSSETNEEPESLPHPFLQTLQLTLALQDWQEQSLSLSPR